jgi:putative tryptophan/tyrosine transport system substrate-binding protein
MNTYSKKIALSLMLASAGLSYAADVKPVTIGIVVPLEHRAMREIVNGFKQELAEKYHGKVNVIVKNAEHDPMLEKIIISQFKAQGVDIIEPIGTDAFEMTLSSVRNKPVIGIAAELTEHQRQQLKNPAVTDVIDETSAVKQLSFMVKAMPHLKKITLIHSADNKIFAEVAAVKQAASQFHIQVQDLMVSQQPELYTVSHHIDANSQAIFILKDHLVVSGIATLVKQAHSLHIPVVASDDGSVQGGAAFALGVREREIGTKSADITAEYLNGKPLKDIPITHLTNLQVFVNKAQSSSQGIEYKQLEQAAQQMGYGIVVMSSK